MYRVKGIAEPLKPLGVKALTPPVQPDGDQRQQRQTLLQQLELVSKQSYRIEQPAQHLRVDIVQADKLSQEIPPSPAPEEIEDQDRQHTRAIVICHDYIARQEPGCHRRQRDRPHDPRLAGPFCPFYQTDDQQRDQKRPDHILVERVNSAPLVLKVKRDLRQDRQKEETFQIPPSVTGMADSLRDQKREYRESKPPHAGEPDRPWEEHSQMVAQHTSHRQDMERCGT